VSGLSETQSDKAMRKKAPANRQTYRFDKAKLPIYLRSLYARDTAKTVGALLKISPHTVSNWMVGKSCPDFETCGDMIALWGPNFLCAVMTPPPPWAVDAMAREELAELKRRSAAIEAELQASEV
jgi:hypothetical protein